VKYYEISSSVLSDLKIGKKTIPAFQLSDRAWVKTANSESGTLYYISYKEPIHGKCYADDYKTAKVELKHLDKKYPLLEIDKDTFEEGVGL
jgi:hypothetical protein